MNELLKYNRPAQFWNEALPMGNGHIGAMVFGKEYEEIISLNEDTLWSGYPMDKTREGAYDAYKKAKEATFAGDSKRAQEILSDGFFCLDSDRYLPLGDLNIAFCHEGDIKDYSRTLDLSQSLQHISYRCGEVAYDREIFVSYPHRVMIIKLTADREKSIGFDLSLSSQLRNKTGAKDGRYFLQGICPVQSSSDTRELIYSENDSEKGMTFSAVCSVLISGGEKTCNAEGISVRFADEAIIYLTAATSYNGIDKQPYLEGKAHFEKNIEVLKNAEEKSYGKIINGHIEDYRQLYERCEFKLDAAYKDDICTDERLENPDDGLFELIYNFGKYLLISSSRSTSSATNLQGIWNAKLLPPWRSNYTVNINTQMNYWSALRCGMTELSDPLDKLIEKIYINGIETAKVLYNAPGFVCHHNTDIWGHTVPVAKGVNWEACMYSYWNMASGWLCRHLFEKYEYTEDRGYLLDFAYPIMKSAALFYKNLLQEYNGKLILPMSTSPENRFIQKGAEVALAKYATMSQNIVYELFENTSKASEILDCDEELRSQIDEILPRLALFEIGSKGQLLEWDAEYEEQHSEHRHVSHLYGLYPGNLIKYNDKKFSDGCRKTLEIRGDDGTGWSLSWKLCLWARLRDGEKALKLLKMQLRPVMPQIDDYRHPGGTYPNMFDAHPPFQIDGNFGVMAGINEMLCQFDGERIALLPSIPKEWRSGSFKNLRFPHGICASAMWEDEKILSYTVTAKGREYSGEKVPFGTEITVK